MKKAVLSFFALGLLATVAHAAPVFDQWSGTGPFATGQGNRVISALAVSADGTVAYAGTGSGTVLRYAYSDTVPDAFSFTAQTGVGLSTVVSSNSITVAGINTGAAISITGGTYKINTGSYVSSAGTVNIGDTVTVQQTSSASFSTTTTATLTIGAATGSFAVTTLPIDTIPSPFSFTAQTGVGLSTSATSGSITVAGINSATPISVTGGTYAINGGAYTAATGSVNNGDTVAVRQTSSAAYSTTSIATLTVGGVSGAFNVTTQAAPADPTKTIPSLPPTVTIPGIAVVPAVVNVTEGAGPSFMDDLIAILSTAVGQPLRFAGQNTLGTVTLSGYHGGNLAFVPSNFPGSGDTRANGIYALGDGRYQVVHNGQSLTIAPALVRLDQLTALFPGLSATLGDNSVITASIGGVTYVVQPGVAVQLDPASGNAQLSMGADGTWHFIDALGNNQILYPAFADPIALRNALQALDPAATVAIQLDGTASIVFNGKPYTLVPDLTLIKVPAERAGQAAWQEGATRYRVSNSQPLGTAQGFTAYMQNRPLAPVE